MSMSGLGIAIEPLTYREGGDNLTTRKMPGQADFNPITLSRGLFPTDDYNWQWMQQLFTASYGTAPPLASPTAQRTSALPSTSTFWSTRTRHLLPWPTVRSIATTAARARASEMERQTVLGVDWVTCVLGPRRWW